MDKCIDVWEDMFRQNIVVRWTTNDVLDQTESSEINVKDLVWKIKIDKLLIIRIWNCKVIPVKGQIS